MGFQLENREQYLHHLLLDLNVEVLFPSNLSILLTDFITESSPCTITVRQVMSSSATPTADFLFLPLAPVPCYSQLSLTC